MRSIKRPKPRGEEKKPRGKKVFKNPKKEKTKTVGAVSHKLSEGGRKNQVI